MSDCYRSRKSNSICNTIDIQKNSHICWNYFFKALERWVRTHKGKNVDIMTYRASLKKLLKCETKEEFNVTLKKESVLWDPAFKDHFETNIIPELDYLGRWILEPLGHYCPYSVITTNCSEGMNNLMKSLNDYNEIPIDVAVLTFFKLSSYYINEIRRGFCNKGLINLFFFKLIKIIF